jgi:hypothetical protein
MMRAGPKRCCASEAERRAVSSAIRGHLDAQLRTSMPREGLRIDTSDMTAEQTVDAIAARLDEAVIPDGGRTQGA